MKSNTEIYLKKNTSIIYYNKKIHLFSLVSKMTTFLYLYVCAMYISVSKPICMLRNRIPVHMFYILLFLLTKVVVLEAWLYTRAPSRNCVFVQLFSALKLQPLLSVICVSLWVRLERLCTHWNNCAWSISNKKFTLLSEL